VVSLGPDAGLAGTARVAGTHHPWGLVAGDHSPGADYGTLTDRNAGPQKSLGADPGIGSDVNRTGKELKIDRLIIVTSSAQMNSLRYDNLLIKVN
jgi:hypothetical protein